jgi:hypothetical protein
MPTKARLCMSCGMRCRDMAALVDHWKAEHLPKPPDPDVQEHLW